MMKKPVKRKPTLQFFDQLELRRWCIEQAIRWPVYETGGYGGAYQNVPMPRLTHDADVLGRAAKILKWITE